MTKISLIAAIWIWHCVVNGQIPINNFDPYHPYFIPYMSTLVNQPINQQKDEMATNLRGINELGKNSLFQGAIFLKIKQLEATATNLAKQLKETTDTLEKTQKTVMDLTDMLKTKADQSELKKTNDIVATKADQSELDKTNNAVAGKAEQSDLKKTNDVVAIKADQSELDKTNNAVAGKADQSELDKTNNAVAAKADQSDLKKTNDAVATKANQSELDKTNNAVAGKANQSELDKTNNAVAGKANQSELDKTNNAVATKAEQSELQKTNDAVATIMSPSSLSTIPASCGDLKNIGFVKSGIYSVMANKQVKNVYCDFTKSSDADFQKWIGIVDVKSTSVNFYAQMSTGYSTASTTSTIPFDSIKLNLGNAFSTTGIFVAPTPGKYYFTFSGISDTSAIARVVLQLRSSTGEWTKVGGAYGHTGLQTFTLHSTLQLLKGDQVKLNLAEGKIYENNLFSYTNFAGGLIEENELSV